MEKETYKLLCGISGVWAIVIWSVLSLYHVIVLGNTKLDVLFIALVVIFSPFLLCVIIGFFATYKFIKPRERCNE